VHFSLPHIQLFLYWLMCTRTWWRFCWHRNMQRCTNFLNCFSSLKQGVKLRQKRTVILTECLSVLLKKWHEEKSGGKDNLWKQFSNLAKQKCAWLIFIFFCSMLLCFLMLFYKYEKKQTKLKKNPTTLWFDGSWWYKSVKIAPCSSSAMCYALAECS